MALYQRVRVWYADFYANGKRVQESTGATNRREAEKFLALRTAEIERGEYARPVKVTLSEFGERYIEYARANKRSWHRDEQIMVHLNAALGPMQLADIGPFPTERYKIERVKVASPATVNREIALVKHMFNPAEQWGLFRGRNPMKGIKFLSENNLQFRSVTEAEEATLLRYCSPYLQDLVVFAINTGFRLGEILKLKWEEADLDHGTVRTLVRKTQQMIDLPLNDEAARVVRGWHGADLVTVKELLGHSTISVTTRYAHTNRDAKTRAVRLLTNRSDKVVTVAGSGKKPA